MVMVGPVQLLAVAFGPDAEFVGRITEELDILESNGQIRVLDLLFVQKKPDGTLFALHHQAMSMGDTVAALLGLPCEPLRGTKSASSSPVEGNASGLTVGEIRELTGALDPGTAAGFILLEHTWAKYLRKAILDTGGTPVAEGFLTAATLGPVAAHLAVAAERLGEPVAPPSRAGRPAACNSRRA
ncbi:DUF1269 domain-containing protein [Streptomyces poonensis]|uniref:DUF1269 domain-containing protein n=1 Tax=Streptomyces poonensis TaxID=68255 RepID=A0A918QEK4_9ACTN|nr:DUF1269 domain-containing protein [Streptomyces poonensis]GGZ43458.1 hypothetical protein GCM10010365_75030 [Streptomyces poonensis]GLJ91712.1 hypothetical protein GCM10017589_43190 [Streptomyces poonensis]